LPPVLKQIHRQSPYPQQEKEQIHENGGHIYHEWSNSPVYLHEAAW